MVGQSVTLGEALSAKGALVWGGLVEEGGGEAPQARRVVGHMVQGVTIVGVEGQVATYPAVFLIADVIIQTG